MTIIDNAALLDFQSKFYQPPPYPSSSLRWQRSFRRILFPRNCSTILNPFSFTGSPSPSTFVPFPHSCRLRRTTPAPVPKGSGVPQVLSLRDIFVTLPEPMRSNSSEVCVEWFDRQSYSSRNPRSFWSTRDNRVLAAYGSICTFSGLEGMCRHSYST